MALRAAQKLAEPEPPAVAEFEEQLWPIHCTIFVLTGFVVGIVIARSDFNPAEANWWQSGYVHLGFVVTMAGLLLWLVTLLHARVVRRVFFCVLFSLLVHLGLMVYLHGRYLALAAVERLGQVIDVALAEERITLPDYYWHHPDQLRPMESFERPVETGDPEPLPVEPVDRHVTEREAIVERAVPVEPELPEPEIPDPAAMARRELAPPERVEQAEPVRRAPSHARPEPDEQVDTPEIPPARDVEPPPPIELESRPALARHEVDTPQTVRREPEPAPIGPQQITPALTRQNVVPREQLPELEPAPATPETLARADVGVRLPAAIISVEEATMPAATGGAAPSTIEIASSAAAVDRSEDSALERADTAAAGPADFALGPSRTVARVGQRRAIDRSSPSADPTDPVRQIARSRTALPVPTISPPQLAEIPTVASASGAGGPPTTRLEAQGTPVGPAGSVGIRSPRPSIVAGTGPDDSPGMAGPVPQAQLARVAGPASIAAVQAGGGTPMPTRRFGRAFAGDATVGVPPIATGPPSGGVATGPPLDAQPSGQAQLAAGLPGSLQTQPRPGAPDSLTGTGRRRPSAVARRAAAGQQEPGILGISPAHSATLARAGAGPKMPAAIVPLEEIPIPGAGGVEPAQGGQPSTLEPAPNAAVLSVPDGPGRVMDGAGGPSEAAVASLRPGRPEARLTAPSASLRGGPLPVAGNSGRRPLGDPDLTLSAGPRLAKRTAAMPTIEARVPTEAFRQRDPAQRAEIAKQYGATGGSERAVEMGLDFLARTQFPDGHWSLHAFPNPEALESVAAAPGQMKADTAATGLALLAFLGAGYTHLDNDHRLVVQKGLEWLLGNQQSDGRLFTDATDVDRPARSYAHAIATIALCEAYGMTRDPQLREAARQAIGFIVQAQHPTLGGWRYVPESGPITPHRESDTSVSGWMLMALKSAQMAGLDVPPEAMQRVGRWLDLAQADGGSRYRYNLFLGDESGEGSAAPNRAMTAEGLLMRMYLGWDRNHPAMIGGADYLRANLPHFGTPDASLRDAYYWYYATQVMYQMQGDYWTAWNDRLRPMLKDSQVQEGPLAGSWAPEHPTPDRWSHTGGRLYVTSLNLLMLEVYYRYLPLFKTLVDEQ